MHPPWPVQACGCTRPQRRPRVRVQTRVYQAAQPRPRLPRQIDGSVNQRSRGARQCPQQPTSHTKRRVRGSAPASAPKRDISFLEQQTKRGAGEQHVSHSHPAAAWLDGVMRGLASACFVGLFGSVVSAGAGAGHMRGGVVLGLFHFSAAAHARAGMVWRNHRIIRETGRYINVWSINLIKTGRAAAVQRCACGCRWATCVHRYGNINRPCKRNPRT